MADPFFTIGHSTRPICEFVELLSFAHVEFVIDVRTIPRSRTNPQYNFDTLPETLSQFQIEYEHIAELGGLRRKKHDISPVVNAFWRNQSFHNYADYALSETFQLGFKRLCALGHEQRCAVMCAEAVWWRCHRRLIADYLIAAGETVFHILGKGHTDPAHMTSAAERAPDGLLTYPALQHDIEL
jgi:uncharacterized protein (DUF488 family)